MASGFFAILDDIAALMDDVAMTSKLATKKTAGILGDDLAVNAEKATGFLASREIPVLWAITKGSFINKLIILPVVFVLNWLYPPAIKAALIIGGVYLAYEGVEKIIEYFFHRAKKGEEVIKESKLEDDNENSEKAKVSSAIKTDFILSLEIVIIALGTAMEKQHELIKIDAHIKQKNSELEQHNQAIDYYNQYGKKVSQEIIKVANMSYKQGEIDFFQFIQSLENATTIQVDYLDAVNQYNQTQLDLQYINIQ